MNRWTKWLVAFAAVVVAIAIGMAALTASDRGSSRSLVFADGARVTLLSAEVPVPAMPGPRSSSISMTRERYDGGWHDWLYPKLPRNVLAKLGVQPPSLVGFSTNSMGIWLRFQNAPTLSTPQSDFRIRVSDDAGIESQDFWSYFTTSNDLAFYVIPNYPHRSSNVSVRVYHSDSRHPGELAKGLTFVLPNSAPATPPNWPAEPMPATRMTNGLEITLTSLETGLSNLSLGSTANFTTEGGRMYSRANFELREAGQMATNWELTGLKCSAATGDSLSVLRPVTGWYNGLYTVAFDSGLWSEEPAWEVTAEFQRTTNFPADELWSVKGIKVPALNQTVAIGSLTNFDGVEDVTADLTGESRPTPNSDRDVEIDLQLTHHLAGVRAILVEIRDDEAGGLVTRGDTIVQAGTNNTTYIYTYPVSPKATSLNLTFAITKSRFATFRVKPTVAP